MSDIFSQDEIDAMLGAVSGGVFDAGLNTDFGVFTDNNFNDNFNERENMTGHCKDCQHVSGSRCKKPDKVDNGVRNVREIWLGLDAYVKATADRDGYYSTTQLLINTIEDIKANGVPLPACPYGNGCFVGAETPESKKGESCAE